MSGEVCFVNIGRKGQQRRATLGVLGIVAGALVAAVAAATDAALVFRFVPFVLFFNGAFGLWQARDKT